VTPGRYLRLRREAAGLGLGELPIAGTAALAIELDARPPTADELDALRCAIDFDHHVIAALAAGETPRLCRQCACSEWDPCIHDLQGGGSCWWVEHDFCSACAERARSMPEGMAP
jgi:hypothetical protein